MPMNGIDIGLYAVEQFLEMLTRVLDAPARTERRAPDRYVSPVDKTAEVIAQHLNEHGRKIVTLVLHKTKADFLDWCGMRGLPSYAGGPYRYVSGSKSLRDASPTTCQIIIVAYPTRNEKLDGVRLRKEVNFFRERGGVVRDDR